VQLRQLLQLGRQVRTGSRRGRRGSGRILRRRRRVLLLLRLRVEARREGANDFAGLVKLAKQQRWLAGAGSGGAA